MGSKAKRLFSGCGIALGLVLVGGFLLIFALAYPPHHIHGQIVPGGQTRSYLLYIPSTYNPARSTPLVISIHGFASWPQNQMDVSQWNELAEAHGFLVVYPSGTGFPLRWNTGGIAGTEQTAPVEVAFISDLIDELTGKYPIDPRRIYVNGLSNGGGMTHLLACTLSRRVAAVGTVAGAYVDPEGGCQPTRPVPVMTFHGTADPIVPYQGGLVSRTGYRLPVISEWVAGWARRNACQSQPQTLPTAGEVSGIRYTGCSQNAEVVFYTVQGGGHTWPGGGVLPEWITGRTTQDVDASALMWEFFTTHPLN